MLQSCAPVNNITDDKNDKTEKTHTFVSNEISPKTKTDQDTIKLEEKILEKKQLVLIPDESLQNNITIILCKKKNWLNENKCYPKLIQCIFLI